MQRIVAGAVMAFAGTGIAEAQARDPGRDADVSYDVRFDNAVHHEAQIAVTYRDLKPGPVEFRMARSSPGRYALHEFAKNVYSVTATDAAGQPLAVRRADPYSWTVPAHRGTVTLRYTLYGDHGDGTYAQIDPTHAHLNMPATMMWARGYDDRAIRVTFHPLDKSWKIATQLPPSTGSADTFWAPNLQYLMDSPTELSDFQLRTWPLAANGRTYTIRLAVHSQDTPADVDRFAAEAKRVIAQHFALFGGPPVYDFGTYTFIADYMPQISGDGMEHRNSTMISQPRSLKDADFAQIDTLSHEFVHGWNVERLRPRGLEPFDFTRANPTPSLWFAEGFTQYYGPLLIHRAGEKSLDAYLKGLGGTLSGVVNAPARRYGSPQEMSLRAPFVDAAQSIDPVNGTIFVSYYPYGAVVALALDLSLRERYPGLSLDAYMRHMWARNGVEQVDYAPAKPYTPEDLEAGLAELTKDPAFAHEFFAAHVRGSALPDFAPLLAPAGLTLRHAAPAQPWLGATRVKTVDGALTLDEIPAPDTPLYRAGVDRGDTLVSLGGQPLATPEEWTAALATASVGKPVPLAYRDRTGDHRVMLTPLSDPRLEIVRTETLGTPLTPAQHRFRAAWLGTAD
ncbi:M61 family peptidase [Sphingomonas oligophenolica]|uniref:M61 family peptidase n=2 Tax=Sphingomonas oligophenolica TaxID=301154 RepID=A0A502CE09_9SPHN|nr:M61 family peptidase [Sphingomonas oligophenolica]